MTATAGRRVSVCVLTYNHARYIRDCLLFVLSLLNLLFDVRHWRSTAWSFARLTVQSASFVSPLLILRTIVEKRRLPPCSPMGVHDIARMRAKKRFGEASEIP